MQGTLFLGEQEKSSPRGGKKTLGGYKIFLSNSAKGTKSNKSVIYG